MSVVVFEVRALGFGSVTAIVRNSPRYPRHIIGHPLEIRPQGI
jgi:hypothetical protein